MGMSVLGLSVRAVEEAMLQEATRKRAVTDAEVDAVLAEMPMRAREGKRGSPGAASFVLHEWAARDHHGAAVGEAVENRLAVMGLASSLVPSVGPFAGYLQVSYADLKAAAEREVHHRDLWIELARAAWAKVGGGGSDVRLSAARDMSAVAVFVTRGLAVPRNAAMPFRADHAFRAREHAYEVQGFQTRPIDETVREAEDALRPVRWAFEDVERAWAAAGGGQVSFTYGMFDHNGLRQCPVLELHGDGRSYKLAVEDVRHLTAEEVVARAGVSTDVVERQPLAVPDKADLRIVAGAERDADMGIGPGVRRDDFVYVLPPGPPRIHVGDTVPVEDMVDGVPVTKGTGPGIKGPGWGGDTGVTHAANIPNITATGDIPLVDPAMQHNGKREEPKAKGRSRRPGVGT